MGDSSMSASELRNRYHQGGSAGDADLSASQLRARYGIASNRAGGCRRPSSFASNASLVDNSSRRVSTPGRALRLRGAVAVFRRVATTHT